MIALATSVSCSRQYSGEPPAHADELAKRFIILDTHIDVPYRLNKEPADISNGTETGDFDYHRAVAGGLDGAFMSIYTPAELEAEGRSKALADSLIDMVEGFASDWPDKFAMAISVEDVRTLKERGRFALLLGMENGSPIEGDLANLSYFYQRGVRYITLTHSLDNHISDSSYDTTGTWGGLSPFGKQVVPEMNRLGIAIDVSHLSDEAFYDVIGLTKAPVMASHSSCRYFTPEWERNMSDDMIKTLAANGGVIQINFGSTFIRDDVLKKYHVGKHASEAWARENGIDYKDPAVRAWRDSFFVDNHYGFADVTDVVDHIDHVVALVGVDHVGFGSDFDGVGDSLPTGLKDVSDYPNVIAELLDRGYSEDDIEKICSGNLLRVLDRVERTSAQLRAAN